MRGRARVRLGRVIPAVFWTTTVICGWVLGNYNHATRQVSELGAIGTPSLYLFSAGLLGCAVLSVLFVTGLVRACRNSGVSRLPALLILSYPLSIAGAALFPLPLRMHLIMGMPSVLLLLSPLAALLLWRQEGAYGGTFWTWASLLIMALGFLAFFPGVLPGLPGVKQRFFHLGWTIWFLFLSARFAPRRGGE